MSDYYKIIFIMMIILLYSCQDGRNKTKTLGLEKNRGYIRSVIVNVDEGLNCSTCKNMTGAYIEYVLPYSNWDSLEVIKADNYLISSLNDTIPIVLKRLNGVWISSYNIPYTIEKKEQLIAWFKIVGINEVVLSQIEEEVKKETKCKFKIIINTFCDNNNCNLMEDTLMNCRFKYYFNNKRLKEVEIEQYIDSLSSSFYISNDDKYEEMMEGIDNL